MAEFTKIGYDFQCYAWEGGADDCSFLLVCEGSEFRVKNGEATAHHEAAAQAEPQQ